MGDHVVRAPRLRRGEDWSGGRREGAHCRSCGAPIRWCLTTNGHKMPIDRELVADGEVILTTHRSEPLALVYDPAIHGDAPRYRSHFKTCPHADEWRRKRERKLAAASTPGSSE
jgi:hypothetical protein